MINMKSIEKIRNILLSQSILRNRFIIRAMKLNTIKAKKEFFPAFNSSLVPLAIIIPVGIASKITNPHNAHCSINIKKNINLNL